MAVQQGKKDLKKRKPVKQGYRAPKHTKTVRQFDLAPSETKRFSMTRKEREINMQMKPSAGDVKKAMRGRKADTRGLYDPKTSKNTTPKLEIGPVEFQTTARANESIEQYEHRLKMEELRITRAMGGYEHRTSERRLEYKRDRRATKADKKRFKEKDHEQDLDFTGKTEHIAFGEVVERPPSFADMKLPGENLKVGGKIKSDPQMSNLEKLQQALKTTNSNIKTISGDHSENEESGDETTDPLKLAILAQQRKEKQQERERLLKIAREKQRAVDLEKARLQAQNAYQQLKSKRGGESGSKVHMGTLTSSTKTIYQAGVKAMRDLNSVDGGVYHHGR